MSEQVPEATNNDEQQPALDEVGNADNEAGEEVEVDESGEQKG